MNNNYVSDLRNDLAATIDELDRCGIADCTRLAIRGHSYVDLWARWAAWLDEYVKSEKKGDRRSASTDQPGPQ